MASLADRVIRAPRAHDPERAKAALAGLDPGLVRGPLGAVLRGAAGSAPYLAGLIEREGGWLADAARTPPEAAMAALLSELAPGALEGLTRDALGLRLRRVKARAALLIALADLAGAWDLGAVTAALSGLADAALSAAIGHLLAEEIRARRLPGMDEADLATACGYVVLAMGKHGAGELNYSSDIDLICLFDQDRFEAADYAAARPRFIEVTRALVRLIGEQTGAGYVFRVDLRLRPSPSTTPVCLGLEAAERYYESVGRTWERAAHIKARAAAGDLGAGARHLEALAPFVWRRSLDFSAIEDIHGLFRQIRGQGRPPTEAPGADLKRSPGGIRAIEFFVQTGQLIHGGRMPALRVRGTLAALAALAGAGLIEGEAADALAADYVRLRTLEHRLQMKQDAQTHEMPRAPEARARLAALAGAPCPEALEAETIALMGRVHRLTEAFFAPAPAPRPGAARRPPAPVGRAELAAMGFARPDDALARLDAWRSSKIAATRTPRARALYRELEPKLLACLAAARAPDEAMAEIDRFLSGLPAGVQVFSLFHANPHLLDLIAEIAAAAPRLASYLGRRPQALDALLGRDFFAPLPGARALARDLDAWIGREADYERQLDRIRIWAREQQFRAGVQVLRGMAAPEEAGAAFSAIAEACLAVLMPLVTAEFARRHGPPPGRGMAVLALGKLGTREMTAGSDIDLITVYDAEPDSISDGPRPLPPASYYPRLTQALVAGLSAQTAEGQLYAVDMRLRPSGRTGPVATSLAAFRRYQAEDAWVWEHMALTRARAVAGTGGAATGGAASGGPTAAPLASGAVTDRGGAAAGVGDGLGAEVEAAADAALRARAGDPRVLPEAREMRSRLIAAHGRDRARPWALKHAAGGLMEIEFLAQTGRLAVGLGRGGAREALPRLAAAGWLEPAEAEAALAALRLVQGLQQLERVALDHPVDPDAAGRALAEALARAAGAEDLATATAKLAEAEAAAAAVAARVFGPADPA